MIYEVTINLYPDVNPNTGEPLQRHRRMFTADNTVHHNARYASHILLPMIPVANKAGR